jgi:MAF protein
MVDCVRIRNMSKPLLVLASNSPRRRELLALGGWMFHTRPADVDESQRPGEEPGAYVLRLAESKARTCAASAHPDLVIVAADTTVASGNAILGKPKDMAEAVEMLKALRGRSHQVYTGIAVLRMSDGRLVTDLCITDVPMRAYRDDEIEAYVATGDPLDKAGAYAIQNAGFHPVEALRGCYACVMGLPLCHLARSLQKIDIAPRYDIAEECQSALKYACPISAAVLRGEKVG